MFLSADHVYAVITGDIVGSTELSPDAMAAVRDTITETVRTFASTNDPLSKGVEFFRGDSWQVLLGDPAKAFRLAILIQAQLQAKTGVETRAAIGIGAVEGLENQVAISTGQAFTLSGRALESISNAIRLTGALPNHNKTAALWFPALLHLCSGLMRGWTRRQAEVMGLWLSLPHPTYDAIASRLEPPIAKQSVGDILTSANLPFLREAMKIFQATDWQSLAAPEQEGKP